MPLCLLAFSSTAGLASQSATTFVSGQSANPGRWFASAIPPLPIIATPIVPDTLFVPLVAKARLLPVIARATPAFSTRWDGNLQWTTCEMNRETPGDPPAAEDR